MAWRGAGGGGWGAPGARHPRSPVGIGPSWRQRVFKLIHGRRFPICPPAAACRRASPIPQAANARKSAAGVLGTPTEVGCWLGGGRRANRRLGAAAAGTPCRPPHPTPSSLAPQDVAKLYTLGRVLGKGQFGTTRLAEERSTGRELACKSIAKRKLTTAADVGDVRREVQIMHHLKGCPHVVTLHGAYEDKHNVHLVMVRLFFLF